MHAGVEVSESKAQKDQIIIQGNDIEAVSQSAADIHTACLVKNKGASDAGFCWAATDLFPSIDIRKVRAGPCLPDELIRDCRTVPGRHIRRGEGQRRGGIGIGRRPWVAFLQSSPLFAADSESCPFGIK
jgi:hypothetical protein